MAADPKIVPVRQDMPHSRRVATAPVTFPSSQSSSSSSTVPPSNSPQSEGLVETLYSHPSVKIIAFTATRRGSSFSTTEDRPGTLPASSRLERTIAVGQLSLYRAPKSVAFLSCGSALQPILPKSQCWCIDEDNSRFVLQIRRPQFWRIELPVSEPDDQDRASLLRDVLDRVLQFEKTECPFERSFTVELPEQQETPKKPWTPEGKNLLSSPFFSLHTSQAAARLFGKDRRASISADEIDGHYDTDWQNLEQYRSRFEESIVDEREEDSAQRPRVPVDIPSFLLANHDDQNQLARMDATSSNTRRKVNSVSRPATVSRDSVRDNNVTPSRAQPTKMVEEKELDSIDEPNSFEGSGRVAPINLSKKRMSRALAGRAYTARAYTAPPHLSTVNPPPSSESKVLPDTAAQLQPPQASQPAISERNSPVVSTESFHSVQSWNSTVNPLPPSPPASRPVTPSIPPFPSPHEDVPHQLTNASDTLVNMNSPDTNRTLAQSPASATERSDEAPSPVPQSPADSEDYHTNPASVDSSSRVSYPSALEERPEPRQRPRPRPNSLSISRRALSPLPSAANFFSSPPPRQPPQSRIAAVRRLPGVIVQKTVEIFLGPPSYLLDLMLKVAAKIAAGEWRGIVFGFGERGEKIPVQWDYSDGEFSSWSDDEDYAMARCKQSSNSSSQDSITQTTSRGQRRSMRAEDSRGWEVD